VSSDSSTRFFFSVFPVFSIIKKRIWVCVAISQNRNMNIRIYMYIYIYRCIWIVCWAAQLWFQSWFLFRFFNQQVDAAYTGLLQIYLCLGQEDLVVHFHIASLPKIFSCSVIGQPEDCRLRPGHDLQVINCWRRPRPTGALSWFDFAWFCY
jgi:hypothetical protein